MVRSILIFVSLLIVVLLMLGSVAFAAESEPRITVHVADAYGNNVPGRFTVVVRVPGFTDSNEIRRR